MIETSKQARDLLLSNYIKVKNEIINQTIKRKEYGFNGRISRDSIQIDLFESVLDDTIYFEKKRLDEIMTNAYNEHKNEIETIEDEIEYKYNTMGFYRTTNIRFFKMNPKIKYFTLDQLISDYVRYYFSSKHIKGKSIHELVYLQYHRKYQNQLEKYVELELLEIGIDNKDVDDIEKKNESDLIRNTYIIFSKKYLNKLENIIFSLTESEIKDSNTKMYRPYKIDEIAQYLYLNHKTVSKYITSITWRFALYCLNIDILYNKYEISIDKLNKQTGFRNLNKKYFNSEYLLTIPSVESVITILESFHKNEKYENYKTEKDFDNIPLSSLKNMGLYNNGRTRYRSKYDFENNKHDHYITYVFETCNGSHIAYCHKNKEKIYVDITK